MGFIDIDDRDTHNYYGPQVTTKIYKELFLQLKSNNLTCRVVNIGAGAYKIDVPTIICNGSDIETLLTIPFNHYFTKMELKHTDSTDLDSHNSLKYILQKRTSYNLWLTLYQESNVYQSDIFDEYIGFNHELCQYILTTNSTNTDKLYVTFYVYQAGD